MRMLVRRIIALAVALLLPVAAIAADDPFIGSWRIDRAKSTIAHDPGVKNKEIVISPAPNGGTITETLEMVSAPGEKQVSRLTYVYGQFTPQDRADLDAFLVVRSGDRRVLWTARRKGETIARLQADVSEDGKELTFRYLFSAADPSGKVTEDRYVYDRQ